jgi:carbohydrate kinase (thermoresistant glucokinase family)
MGPAGSGKTVVGRRVAARLGVDFVDGDDLHDVVDIEAMRRGVPLDGRRREPWLDRLHAELVARREQGLVLACSALRVSYRRRLERGLRGVRFVALMASADVLRARLAARRDHFAGPSLLRSQLEAFELSDEVVVVDGDGPVDVVAQRVVAAVRDDATDAAP